MKFLNLFGTKNLSTFDNDLRKSIACQTAAIPPPSSIAPWPTSQLSMWAKRSTTCSGWVEPDLIRAYHIICLLMHFTSDVEDSVSGAANSIRLGLDVHLDDNLLAAIVEPLQQFRLF